MSVLHLVFGWRAVLGGGEPPVHWVASYIDAAGAHTVEVWRQPGHVRHVTDRRLELDAVRPAGEGYRFVINDLARQVSYRGTERDRIQRGSFDDWQRWTHVVAPARPDALVFPLGRPEASTPAGRCRWFADGDRELCWSRSLAIPLVIRAGGKDVYTVSLAEAFHGSLAPLAPLGDELGGDDD
ncbi:MAG TPA: hypothetical protein VFK02_01925 [Kofleriaceae bacterium]|nr:hypothetical protein [Kofleriaceae bacterium]